MLRLLGGARGAGTPTGKGEGREHIVSPRAQLVIKPAEAVVDLKMEIRNNSASDSPIFTKV